MPQNPVEATKLTALLVQGLAAAQVPITGKGAPSQTSNLLELQDSTGVVKFSVSAAGTASGVVGNSGVNVPTGQTAVVTDPDSLTVGGVIVPQQIEVTFRQNSNASIATEGFFIANVGYKVIAIREIHATAGTDAGAVTVSITKDTGTQAPGAGITQTTAAISLKATANTVQTPALSATASDLTLAAGNRLAALYAGTLTAVAGVSITVSLKRV